MSNLLLIVTGASRGFGRAVAIAFVDHIARNFGVSTDDEAGPVDGVGDDEGRRKPLPTSIRAALIARCEDDLNRTADLMKEAAVSSKDGGERISLRISCHPMDLADLESLEAKFDDVLEAVSVVPKDGNMKHSQYDRTVLINNAGSLGEMGPSVGISSLGSWRKAMDFNVTSSVWVSSRFARSFASTGVSAGPLGKDDSASQDDERLRADSPPRMCSCTIVQISSLTATRPFKTLGMYCTGKAARDMFHSVLAAEMGSSAKNVCVLNYAPGHTDTDMQEKMRKCDELEGRIRGYLTKLKEEGKLVQPDDAARHLVGLVFSGDFTSGQHLDFWDVMKNR